MVRTGALFFLITIFSTLGLARPDRFHTDAYEKLVVMETELQGYYELSPADQMSLVAGRLGTYREQLLPLTEEPSVVRESAVTAIELVDVTEALVVDNDEDSVSIGVGFLLQVIGEMKLAIGKLVVVQ